MIVIIGDTYSHNEYIDGLQLQEVEQIVVETGVFDPLFMLIGCIQTIKNNHYPRIEIATDIFNDEEKKKMFLSFLQNLGYQAITSNGNMWRAFEKTKTIPELLALFQVNKFLNDDEYLTLATHLRLHDDHDTVIAVALRGLKIIKDLAIVAKLYYEMGISAYYTKYREHGLEYCDQVILHQYRLPFDMINTTINNSHFYMKPISVKKRLQILPACHAQLRAEEYINSTSSLIQINDDDRDTDSPVVCYRYNIRYVNYRLTNGVYSYHGEHKFINTRNILLDLDENFNILAERELVLSPMIKNKVMINQEREVKGLEDIRLIPQPGDLSDDDHNYYFDNNEEVFSGAFFCTCLQTNMIGTPQMCLGFYNSKGVVYELIPLSITKDIQCEKNWTPFPLTDDAVSAVNGIVKTVDFIYAWQPFCIYTFDLQQRKYEMAHQIKLFDNKNLSTFRGSSSPIPYKDGYLCLVHHIYHATSRKYFHRLVWVAEPSEYESLLAHDDMNGVNDVVRYSSLCRYSLPFYFQKAGVEFNLSITHSPQGLIVTNSDNDSTSFINIIDYHIINNMLNFSE